MRTERDAFWRATLAGLAAVGGLALAACLIASDVVGRPTADRRAGARAARLLADLEPQPPSAAASTSDRRSLRSTRRIARGQLRDAGRALRTCPSPAQVTARRWGSCVRWPLAHLAIDGRTSGGVLSAIAGREALAGCREQVMEEASGLRMLGSESDQLVRGLANSSTQARGETARTFASTWRLIVDLRRQMRRPLRGCAYRG
jgi:hypothetical protein